MNTSKSEIKVLGPVDGIHVVRFGKIVLGEISQEVDGEYVFYQNPTRRGFWRSWLFKSIAGELDKLNNSSNI